MWSPVLKLLLHFIQLIWHLQRVYSSANTDIKQRDYMDTLKRSLADTKQKRLHFILDNYHISQCSPIQSAYSYAV